MQQWWLCPQGHSWQRGVHNVCNITIESPYCSQKKVSNEYNLGVKNPELVSKWHIKKITSVCLMLHMVHGKNIGGSPIRITNGKLFRLVGLLVKLDVPNVINVNVNVNVNVSVNVSVMET